MTKFAAVLVSYKVDAAHDQKVKVGGPPELLKEVDGQEGQPGVLGGPHAVAAKGGVGFLVGGGRGVVDEDGCRLRKRDERIRGDCSHAL